MTQITEGQKRFITFIVFLAEILIIFISDYVIYCNSASAENAFIFCSFIPFTIILLTFYLSREYVWGNFYFEKYFYYLDKISDVFLCLYTFLGALYFIEQYEDSIKEHHVLALGDFIRKPVVMPIVYCSFAFFISFKLTKSIYYIIKKRA